MRPWWHFILGGLFAGILWAVAPEIKLINLGLVFLASFLIDFDHYVAYFLISKKWSFKDWVKHHVELNKREDREISKGIRRKSDFHLFHTIEFHLVIGLLGLLWVGFFYLFIGMIYHSLIDVVYLASKGKLHRREYFLTAWIRKKI